MTENRIIYHGGKEIVEFPEIRTAKYNKDFYFGFYCTYFKEQAERWATRYGRTGIVNEYSYTPSESSRAEAEILTISILSKGLWLMTQFSITFKDLLTGKFLAPPFGNLQNSRGQHIK